MEATDLSHLVTALNGLTSTGVIGLILVGIFFLAFMRSKQKDKEVEQSAKNERSRAYSEAMERLAGSIQMHDRHSIAALNESSDQLRRNQTTLAGLAKVVSKLEAKSAGKMSRTNSLDLIETVFNQVTLEFQAALRQSLLENDYAHRQLHIERRVKGRLSKVLTDQRAMLSRIDALSIDFLKFFPTCLNNTEQRGSETFVLTEQTWEKVKGCYTVELEIAQRIEEACTIIEEIVWMHFAHVRRELNEIDKPTDRQTGRRSRSSSRSAALEKRVE